MGYIMGTRSITCSVGPTEYMFMVLLKFDKF
jgi:hypothetical protein